MNNFNSDQLNNLDIRVDNQVKNQFAEAAKWSKFISILVFVFAGIMLVVGVTGGSYILQAFEKLSGSIPQFENVNAALIIGAVVVVVALVSVNYFFLYKFATKIKQAISTEDQMAMTEALSALKIFFIISVVISGLSIIKSILDLF